MVNLLSHIDQLTWLIPVLPLIAFLVIVGLTSRAKMLSAIVATSFSGASLLLSLLILAKKVIHPATTEYYINWLNLTSDKQSVLNIQLGYLMDPLAAVMCCIVALVATLVLLYSIGYMKDDVGFSRYFAYISLFTFSMFGLVISNNYFETFVFWELVGFCSYLLIGFWFFKPEAAEASKKAFITNRWADFGFLVGVIGLFTVFGTFNFAELATRISGYPNLLILMGLGLLVFLGPAGKSAMFPFHVWLPDAMEGPTPISALIHAATMVAAGIYLVARGYILFESVTPVLTLIAYIGGFTALFAATIALVQRDIKRILAYSTLSQLGYMMMALGVGSMTSGMFHLTTHAFFKALLFLGAGSIIHAVHDQDIFKMGGLSKKMPITTWTFVIGALALSGIFPLAGFWSKDEILTVTLQHHFTGLFILGVLVAFLTAFYMFRLIFVALFGANRSDHHGHEAPWVMTLPLIILAVLSVIGGWVNTPLFYHMTGMSFGTFVFFKDAEAPVIHYTVAILSSVVALLGIFFAWLIYSRELISADALAKKMKGAHKLLLNKYYIDEIYAWVFNHIMVQFGKLLDIIDHVIIDGLFDGTAGAVRSTGIRLRLFQTGRLQQYALVFFVAIVIMTLWGVR